VSVININRQGRFYSFVVANINYKMVKKSEMLQTIKNQGVLTLILADYTIKQNNVMLTYKTLFC